MNKKISDSFKDEGKIRIITIPNLLSMFRICLIPIFIWLYLSEKPMIAFGVLVLSGITDVVDGYIARHFNMISAIGKALDPISDKLTQLAVLFCLLRQFNAMLVPIILMVFKEIFSGITALIAIKSTGIVYGADWHGKLTTVSLYAMMAIHIIWPAIPRPVSNIIIGICVVLMVISLVLYSFRSISMSTNAKKNTPKESA